MHSAIIVMLHYFRNAALECVLCPLAVTELGLGNLEIANCIIIILLFYKGIWFIIYSILICKSKFVAGFSIDRKH